MEYNSQKANREKVMVKAQLSAAAPFFNFVTENWYKVAAGRPTLDGKGVHELLWQQWVGRLGGDVAKQATEGNTGAAVVRREQGVKRIKTMVHLEKVKVDGRQVEESKDQSENRVVSLALFTEKISSELERVAPSKSPHQGDVVHLGDIKRATKEVPASPVIVGSCFVMDEVGGEVVSQAEQKRRDEHNENSQEDLETSFDSEVKFRTNCKFSSSHVSSY